MTNQDILDEEFRKQYYRRIRGLFYTGPVPTILTQEEMEELSRKVRKILDEYPNTIPVLDIFDDAKSPDVLPLPRRGVGFEVATFHNVPILYDTTLEWRKWGNSTSREEFRKRYILPAVRHYKVKRE